MQLGFGRFRFAGCFGCLMVGFVELYHLRVTLVCGSFAFAFSCELLSVVFGFGVFVMFVVVIAGFADCGVCGGVGLRYVLGCGLVGRSLLSW